MNASTLPICPHCKQTDQIQKVSSVFNSNTKEWKESYSTTDSWGNTDIREETKRAHTVLGLKLKPPDEPSGPTHPGLWYGIGAFVAVVLSSVCCSFALVPLGLFVPLLGGAALLPDVAGMPAWLATLLGVGLPTLCAVVLVLGGLLWLGSTVRKRFDRDMKNYREKRAVFERDELPRWKGAMQRWEQLFYCMRDETIFIPAEGHAVRADDMQKYLYDPYFRR